MTIDWNQSSKGDAAGLADVNQSSSNRTINLPLNYNRVMAVRVNKKYTEVCIEERESYCRMNNLIPKSEYRLRMLCKEKCGHGRLGNP